MFNQSKNYQNNFKKIKDSDIFLASYPRSGNTWLRLLLSDIILQKAEQKTTTGGNLIPDIYKIDLDNWYNNNLLTELPWRIIKTHEPYNKEYKKIIYLFRNPIDSLCSYYYYSSQRNAKIIQDINEFCLDKITQWNDHVNSYLIAQKEWPEYILFISYESLHQKTKETLNLINIFLGLNVNLEIIETAIENQAFNNLKQLSQQEDLKESQEKLGFWEHKGYLNFFYQGQINGYQNDISSETKHLIETKTREIYEQAKTVEFIQTITITS